MNAFLSFVQANQNVDYTFVIPLVLGYIALFWLIVSIWVSFDAKKRYKGRKMAVLIGVGNFIFGVPFILLYILFRPIEEEYAELAGQGGVNVPIVNFIGKEGVAMSLELRINHNSLVPDNASEMKIDVSFDSKDQNKSIVGPEVKVVEAETLKVEEVKTDEVKKKSNIKASVKNLLVRLKAKLPKKLPKIETDKSLVQEEAKKDEKKKEETEKIEKKDEEKDKK